MRRSVTTPVRVGAAALLVGASALMGVPIGLSSAGAAGAAEDLPESMHGAVETQAVTVGNGALSLLVDPGTAYAYSTLDRDDFGQGSVSMTMTARGANLNLGTIAYAVLWAPPSCSPSQNAPCALSGKYHEDGFNTGLHEAKGFPAYAEALYPAPPEGSGESQERVYKCIVNKDGPGSPPTSGQAEEICKSSDSVPMTAWAEVEKDDVRSSGFSRAGGFDVPNVLAVRGSESSSDVRPIAGGLVKSAGYSNVNGISVLGGAITVDNVYSSATVVSGIDGVDGKQSTSQCTFSGLKVNGQGFDTKAAELADPRLQAQLDQVAAQTGYKVDIVAPQETDVAQVDEGKFVSGCSGLQIKFTDLHTQAPVGLCYPGDTPSGVPSCVPALGNREELSFGRISVQQSVQSLAFSFPEFDEGGLSVGGGDFTEAAGGGTGSLAAGDSPALTGSGSGSGLGAGSGSVGKTAVPRVGRAAGSGSGANLSAENTSVLKKINSARVGALTAAAGVALVVGAMAMVGVVNSLASGQRFRMPGL